jgi:hypothetical protein
MTTRQQLKEETSKALDAVTNLLQVYSQRDPKRFPSERYRSVYHTALNAVQRSLVELYGHIGELKY